MPEISNLLSGFPDGPLRGTVFSFTGYFVQSRNRPGHVSEAAALEALLNPVNLQVQRLGTEIRYGVLGKSAGHPGKYIRVVLLEDMRTIHNAFLDRGAARRLGRNS